MMKHFVRILLSERLYRVPQRHFPLKRREPMCTIQLQSFFNMVLCPALSGRGNTEVNMRYLFSLLPLRGGVKSCVGIRWSETESCSDTIYNLFLTKNGKIL